MQWLHGGALGGNKEQLVNGQQYLMCVHLAGTLTGGTPWRDWHVADIQNDDHGFFFHTDGGWRYRWEDVQWCLPINSLELPPDN